MPLVSVVVPIYNVENYLSNCLESIMKQTMKDIEIILVNDGSTDGSGEICKKYADKDNRIKYVKQRNQGVSAARNTGMDIAIGDYILFVDSDDELNIEMIDKLYEDIEKNHADIAVCKIKRVKKQEEILQEKAEKAEIYSMLQEEALKSYLTESKLEIGVWNKLFRKSVIENLRYYVGRKMNEDKFFAFESIMNAEKITYRDETLYYYYERDNSATTQKFDTKWFDNIFFAEKIYEIVADKKPMLEAEARYQMLMTKYYLILKMKRNRAENSYQHEYRSLMDDIKKIKIGDLNINKRPKSGILMIKYCELAFEIIKKIQK